MAWHVRWTSYQTKVCKETVMKNKTLKQYRDRARIKVHWKKSRKELYSWISLLKKMSAMWCFSLKLFLL